MQTPEASNLIITLILWPLGFLFLQWVVAYSVKRDKFAKGEENYIVHYEDEKTGRKASAWSTIHDIMSLARQGVTLIEIDSLDQKLVYMLSAGPDLAIAALVLAFTLHFTTSPRRSPLLPFAEDGVVILYQLVILFVVVSAASAYPKTLKGAIITLVLALLAAWGAFLVLGQRIWL